MSGAAPSQGRGKQTASLSDLTRPSGSADELNRREIPTANSGRWYATAMANLLSGPIGAWSAGPGRSGRGWRNFLQGLHP